MTSPLADTSRDQPRLPTSNRELAQRHTDAIYRSPKRRTLLISTFAFFASILTLGTYSVVNLDLGSPERRPEAREGAAGPEAVDTAAQGAAPAVEEQVDEGLLNLMIEEGWGFGAAVFNEDAFGRWNDFWGEDTSPERSPDNAPAQQP